MIRVAKFTFSPFQENTYVLSDDTKECIIIDPGCFTAAERQTLQDFISSEGLTPVRLLNTHCHLDHVFGNQFVANTYGLELEIHQGEIPVLASFMQVGMMYGLPAAQLQESPKASRFLEAGDEVTFGNSSLKVLFTPGHSPASISFYSEADALVIGGDVLFRLGIGRVDLPGGNAATLMNSIKTQLLPLGDKVKVYSGHGAETTIGYERKNNPYLLNDNWY